jgi:hypothetical protein
MNRVVDLTAGDDQGADILDRTGSDGLIGSAYLRDRPLSAHLADEETVSYVLRNEKTGVSVEGGDGALTTLAPDGSHQAFAVVTDVRVLFVVGTADGDGAQTLALADVVTAKAERSGLRTSELRIETRTDAVVTFPCRGDLDAVASAVDGAAQVWAHAARTAENATAAVERAQRLTDSGEFAAALAAVDGVEADLEAALVDLRELGQAALSNVLPTAEAVVDDVSASRRRALAGQGAAAHGSAQSAWRDGAYERAGAAYDRALSAYDAAGRQSGPEPTDEALRHRTRGAARERAVLRAAPLATVLAGRNRAVETDDPAAAAGAWERALDRARDVTGLEWPGDGKGFTVDSGTARAHAADCAEAAIDARTTAARRWTGAGDRIADGDLTPAARRADERAREHLEHALALATELFPDRVDPLEDRLSALAARRSGPDGDGRSGRDAAPAIPDSPFGEDRHSDTAHGAGTGGRLSGPTAGDGDAGGGSTTDGTGDDRPAGDLDREAVLEDLRALDEEGFARTVAALWEHRGWSTTAFVASAGPVYDLVGVGDDPGGERLLVWTEHRPTGAAVGPAVIERIAAAAARGGDGARQLLVTSGRFESRARSRAEAAGVELLDGDALASALRSAGPGEGHVDR